MMILKEKPMIINQGHVGKRYVICRGNSFNITLQQ